MPDGRGGADGERGCCQWVGAMRWHLVESLDPALRDDGFERGEDGSVLPGLNLLLDDLRVGSIE